MAYIRNTINNKPVADGVILGKSLLENYIVDSSRDSILAITKEKSEIMSNSLIMSSLSNWQGNIIIIDYKEKFYKETFEYRKNLGNIINVSEDNLFYDPFSILNSKEYLLTKDELYLECLKLVESMYELAEKYFHMRKEYKSYSINLLASIVFYLRKLEKKEISIDLLINAIRNKPLKNICSDMIKIDDPLISDSVKDILNLSAYQSYDQVFISITNMLNIFKNNSLSNIENIKLNDIFDYFNKYSLYISLTSMENTISKNKVIFLINQILKNRNNLENTTFVILPNFNILNNIPELKEMIHYINKEYTYLKLLVVSDMESLLEIESSFDVWFNSFDKKIFHSLEFNCLKEMNDFPKIKYLGENEVLYLDKYNSKKLKKVFLVDKQLDLSEETLEKEKDNINKIEKPKPPKPLNLKIIIFSIIVLGVVTFILRNF